jgi:3-isopropylmalate/(R)-2-methylmalate dehydratase small subunit
LTLEPFTIWEGVAAPMLRPNIDTDAIIPSREMKRVSKLGLGDGLFASERYLSAAGSDDRREENPEFVLNQPAYRDCSILLAGSNFGCGSSREHAVWALKEFGIRAILAAGFGTIFANNCVRNGLLPVVLAGEDIQRLADWVAADPQGNRVRIDLPEQRVTGADCSLDFDIDDGPKTMLLHGLDAIALTQERGEVIASFDRRRRSERPWLYRS